MKKSISIFVILALLGFKESLYSQEDAPSPKNSNFFILELGAPLSFFNASAMEDKDFKNRGLEIGVDLLLTYRFNSFFDFGVGGFFNLQLAFNTGQTVNSSTSFSTGWNAGGQVKFLFFPEVWISPYIRASIGYDRTIDAGVESLLGGALQLNGIRYTFLGGISLGGKTVRFLIEGGLLGKNNISVSDKRLIPIDRPNIQDSIGYIIRTGLRFNIYLN